MNRVADMAVAAAAAWALIGLLVQFARLRAVPPDHAAPGGRGAAGVRYAFTTAMSPAHKESAAGHPWAFGAGLALHAAIVVALLVVGFTAVVGEPPVAARALVVPVVGLGLACGAALLARRLARAELRTVSVPDDYLASALVLVFLAAALAAVAGAVGSAVLEGLAVALLLYLPLGKLRHAVFFVLARGHLGWRLGLRGAWGGHGR